MPFQRALVVVVLGVPFIWFLSLLLPTVVFWAVPSWPPWHGET